MKISVFGLGYVGVVTAACLARDGHEVWGIDKDPHKVNLLNAGKSPIIEDRIGDYVRDAVESGLLRASDSCEEVVAATEMAIVCVGTPSLPGGGLDMSHVVQVAEEIGAALRNGTEPFLVVVRSTVLTGTLRQSVIPKLETASGRTAADGVNAVFHPEFLREGSSVFDFYNPPKIVVGEQHPGPGEQVMELYRAIDAPRFITSLEIAESIKYCDNLFHAVKVTFANEVGQFCHHMGVDSQEVMRIFVEDTKLNISSKYLRPGFAFGGSCLPKDLRAFLSRARESHLRLPMLENVLVSNESQVKRALEQIRRRGARKIGFYGLAFKPGTDDLRESPLVELAERLLGKGAQLTVYDEHVRVAQLVGGNRAYIQRVLPHLSDVLVEDVAALDDCDLIVVGHPVEPGVLTGWLNQGLFVYDLTATAGNLDHPRYECVV
jgi:GDP-mannose 6-dehydrogenase